MRTRATPGEEKAGAFFGFLLATALVLGLVAAGTQEDTGDDVSRRQSTHAEQEPKRSDSP